MADPFELTPAENIALTVGLAQVQRGESPSQSVSTVCILGLARVAGRIGSNYEPIEPATEN